MKYVENIRDSLSKADPQGATLYAANSAQYITKLQSLDAWIASQVQNVPGNRRLLVTNHDSFGYFTSRYGFTVIGAIIRASAAARLPLPRKWLL